MRYAPRDTKLGKTIAALLGQGKQGVVFLGRGGRVLAEVGPTDYSQYVATRKTHHGSPELKAIAYLNLSGSQVLKIALVERFGDSDPGLSVVVVTGDLTSHWYPPAANAMDIVERQLGKEVIEEEDDK